MMSLAGGSRWKGFLREARNCMDPWNQYQQISMNLQIIKIAKWNLQQNNYFCVGQFNNNLMIIERSESRKRKYSSSTKTKFDVELPKINKTTLLLKDKQKENSSLAVNSYADRVAWVIQAMDYTRLEQKEIEEQYIRLRKQLYNINVSVQKALEKVDIRILKKSKVSEQDPVRALQISDKEIQNGNAHIDRLRKQYLQLQKRLATVSVSSKDEVEQEIEKVKVDIEKTRLKIKELKMKNKSIGESIVNSDDFYEEIKRLENEKEVNERKKMKLQAKTDHVYDQISTSELKLEQISDSFSIAQNFFHDLDGKNQKSEYQRQMEMKIQQAKHCLEVTTRKLQSTNNSKQQKYHILLKRLEEQMGNMNNLTQKTSKIELEIIHSKKLIEELQGLYRQNEIKKQILNQEPVFFTEFETDNGENNDKNQNRLDQSKNKNSQKIREQENQGTKQKPIIENKKAQEEGKNDYRSHTQSKDGVDLEQQQDVIMELDQKFKYNTKSKLGASRYEKETEIGEYLPEEVEEDVEIMDFKTKVTEEKVKRKSNEGFNISKDIDKIKNQIQKFDFMKAHEDSFQ